MTLKPFVSQAIFLGIHLCFLPIKYYEGILNSISDEEEVKHHFLASSPKINASNDIRLLGPKTLDFLFIKGDNRLNVSYVSESQGPKLYI